MSESTHKITIRWETKIEHKKVIFGSEGEIENLVEALESENREEFLRDLECEVKTEQCHETELDFYDTEEIGEQD